MRTEREIIDDVIGIEGGYVNDPSDSGGETKWGITKKVARKYGYKGKMRDMTRDTAIDIYRHRYWDRIKGDAILKVDDRLAAELFEQSVNLGVKRASKHLQTVLNALNDRGRIYRDVAVDGVIGAETLRALYAYKNRRGREGMEVMRAYLNALQAAFYLKLAQKREKDERFVYGWGLNRIVNQA